jgi:hypothetical protein
MQALRTIIDKDDLSSLIIPEEFGRKVEVIILPLEDQSKKEQYHINAEKLEEETQFLTSAYLSTIEEDPQEDQIWGKYL